MTRAKQIPLNSMIRRSEGFSTQEIDDCLVLTDGASNCYGLESIARRIWQLLDRPRAVEELCTVLVGEYDIDRAGCERDVLEFVGELNGEGLIEVV
jgi:hypothetical protein